MTPHELYAELSKHVYDSYPYHRMRDRGDNMEIVEEVIDNYWRERYLINHTLGTAYELMNAGMRLVFLTAKDVDWDSVDTLENNHEAFRYSAYYPRFSVGGFADGVARVSWTLYPDGRFFMDEDGYGMEDNDESVVYGYIDTQARVVIPFQATTWEEMDRMRPEAVRRARSKE